MKAAIFHSLMMIAAALLVGCGSMDVKPWQRGNLAAAEMAWDPDPLDAAMREHTFGSKESAAGGASVGGGGCGCK